MKKQLVGEIMPNEGSNFPGAMQNSSERTNNENTSHAENYNQQSPSYLILSPSNPLRTFAISFLTHWIYSTVIILTICAFVTSSVYMNFWCCEVKAELEEESKQGKEFTLLIWTRRILFIVILLEILIKSVARGFLVGALSYLRLAWDWLDVCSLILIFVSIIIPWKAVDSVAAGIVLLKLIPIHPGSISAFISLCSCAKKLIPVLIYGIIIVWIYGILIFTLFVKYQQDIEDRSVTKANESNSDSVENENITQSRIAGVVDGDYLTPSTSKISQNFSFGLSVECLPTNLRSLSGSLIEACQMLTLGFSQSHLTSTILRGNISTLNKLECLCQYEIYTLSIVETLVIISGTLPMIIMTFGALYDFFQKESSDGVNNKFSLHQDDNETEQESQTSYQYNQRRSLGSGISGRSSNNSHSQNDCGEGSTCLSSSFRQVANILCDCDYYFCCLANLQRRLNPWATRLLNSKRFKVFVMLVVSLDFLCMIMLWIFNNGGGIDFPPTWLIIYCLQICFVLYTIEALFKWFAVSSDEYWLNIWPAFDLILVIVYWIGYTVIQMWSYHSFYFHFCGILIIRTLKIAPYCQSLQHSLKIMVSSLLGKLQIFFVILICSSSTILLKYAIYMPDMQTRWSSHFLTNNSSNLLYFSIPVEYFSEFILYFFCSTVIVCIFIQAIDILRAPQGRQQVNPSISFLLNDSHSDELVNTQYQVPRRSLNESASPISIMSFPSGISSMKYRLATSPCGSSNVLLSQETHSSMLSPSSDVLSPLLSIPTSNGLNGQVQPTYEDNCHHISEEANIQLGNDSSRNLVKQSSYSCSSKEFTLDLASSGVIILSCVNIALDSSETGVYTEGMTWNSLEPGRSLWLEMLFITCITSHIIYKMRLSRFSRETFIQISCVCDLLMVLAVAVEVFSSGMRWLPLKSGPKSVKVFVECAKVISACRGLLLYSRISWLQCVGRSLCKMFWSVANYVASFGYLWIIFIFCSSETQKMISSIRIHQADASPMGSTDTLGNNNSEKTTSIKSDSYNENFIPHSNLILLTVLLFIMSLGGFLGLFIHTVGGWKELIRKYVLPNQMYRHESSVGSSKLGVYPAASHFNHKPTEGICVPVLYFVTNHVTFDGIVMTMILFDGLGISLEHLATSDRALILRKHYPAYMTFLYLLELSCKLGGNGLNFFKSNWNIFDTVIIVVSLTDFLISLIFDSQYVPVLILNVRFLRILRIFQFYPFVQRTQLIQKFFSSISKLYLTLRNFGIFYFSLFLIAIIFRLRCAQFISLEQTTFLWIAAPFQTLKAQNLIFQVLGSLQPENFTVEYTLFFCCLIFISLIRVSVIFSTCLVMVATLCQLLSIQEQGTPRDVTEIPTFHQQRVESVVNGSVDFGDKYAYHMPCISPDTVDIVETPSSSGTNYRANTNNAPASVDIEEPEPTTVQNSIQNNSLYKTTTITSSEEINGCKVFYVEAMITTV